MFFLLETLRLGLKNLALHKLRSLLTALGIIFGVAAVIAMVAIGEGNKLKALAEIKNLGSNNIILRSVKPPDPEDAGEGNSRMLTYGLERRDFRRVSNTLSGVERVVPLKRVGANISTGAKKVNAAAFGTTPDLLELTSLRVSRGRYLTEEDLLRVENVAVIGHEVAQRLFPLQDPLESTFRIDKHAFRVVGVLEPVGLAGGAGTTLVGRDLNFDIHIPMTSAEARYGDKIVRRTSGSFEATENELFEIYIQVSDQMQVRSLSDQVQRLMMIDGGEREDITVIVPLELLRQAERTQAMFNRLMLAIASISLLVGGIGIMNIMLATVTERTREIGIRRAMGATRQHIIAQFLVETTVLSGLGGLLGVALGVLGVVLLIVFQIESPQLTGWSIVVSFVVAVGVGIFFGLYPAAKAAQQDPIVALRHD